MKRWLCLSGARADVVQARMDCPAPATIVFATDLHYGRWMGDRHITALIDQINRLQPDLVLLGGDLAEKRADEERLCARHLSRIRARLGALCVPGNNDYEAFEGDYGPFGAMLGAAGVRLLVNARAVVPLDGARILLSGLDESKYGRPDGRILRFTPEPGDFHILLTHSPWALDQVLAPDCARVDLALCGHTHGGQFALGALSPFMMGYERKARRSRRFFFINGDRVVDGMRLIVSSGVGCSLLPLRVGVPPEIHCLEIGPANCP